jgi:hypothetical protein
MKAEDALSYLLREMGYFDEQPTKKDRTEQGLYAVCWGALALLLVLSLL